MKFATTSRLSKQFIFRLCAIYFFIIVQGSIEAQKTWTLNDCVTYALKNNLTIKKLEYDTKITKNNYTRSFADLGPTIRANGGVNHYYGRSYNDQLVEYTNDDYESGYYNININMTLFNGFQTLNSIRREYFIHKANIYSLEKNKIDIILSVSEKYYNILYYKEVLEAAKEQAIISQNQLDKSERMVNLGKSSKVDYLNIKAQYLSDKANITKAENSLKLMTLDLSQLLALDSISDFTVQDINSVVDTLCSADQVYQEAMLRHPQLKSAEYQLKSTEKGLSIARGGRSPQVSIGGTYASSFNQQSANPVDKTLSYPYSTQIKDNAYQQIGVSISIPIFNKFNIQNSISTAKISVEKSKIEIQQVKQTLYNEINKAYTDGKAALENYHTKTESVNALTEAFQIMQEKFNMGMVSSIDFGISKNNLFTAQAALSLAKYEYILKSTYLQYYAGRYILPD